MLTNVACVFCRRHDSTATASEEETAAREERLLAEQACSNAIFRKQWKKAITLALQLEQVCLRNQPVLSCPVLSGLVLSCAFHASKS